MKRITNANQEYKTQFLRKLWEYENTGYQPNEITPKEGSPAAKLQEPKHKIELCRKETGGKNGFWLVKLDGKEMKVSEFATAIGKSGGTVSSWIQRGIFEKRVKELGLV